MDIINLIIKSCIIYTSIKTNNFINVIILYIIIGYITSVKKYLNDKPEYNKNPFLNILNNIGIVIEKVNIFGYNILTRCKKNYLYDKIETQYIKINNYFNEFNEIIFKITKKNIKNTLKMSIIDLKDDEKKSKMNHIMTDINFFMNKYTDIQKNNINIQKNNEKKQIPENDELDLDKILDDLNKIDIINMNNNMNNNIDLNNNNNLLYDSDDEDKNDFIVT
jgi:hypothetical protein